MLTTGSLNIALLVCFEAQKTFNYHVKKILCGKQSVRFKQYKQISHSSREEKENNRKWKEKLNPSIILMSVCF